MRSAARAGSDCEDSEQNLNSRPRRRAKENFLIAFQIRIYIKFTGQNHPIGTLSAKVYFGESQTGLHTEGEAVCEPVSFCHCTSAATSSPARRPDTIAPLMLALSR